MEEVVNDLEIAKMLGLVEGETTTNGIDNLDEKAETEERVTGETVESTGKVNTGAVAKTVVSVVVMLLGVGIVVLSLRKIKKK